MAPHEDTLLSVQDLSIALPRGSDRPFAVENISFEIFNGEVVCIVGESGSGKSLTANAVMSLLPELLTPKKGKVLFKGVDLLVQSEAVLRSMRGKDMAMIFQEPLSALNPVMTSGKQIVEVMNSHRMYSKPKRYSRTLELMKFVGLPDPESLYHTYPFKLSGGQRQRVMIAMALALEPALLIADEPTTALDVTTQAQILELINGIQKEKQMGVMFVTHDFGVVAEIADRVIVMEKGLIVEQGVAEHVLNHPRHPYTQRLIAAVPERQSSNIRNDYTNLVLEVRDLHKTYDLGRKSLFSPKQKLQAINGVSFRVHAGETLGIVGESGSGKSTIGKCLLGLERINGGEIHFNGQDIAQLTAKQFRPLRQSIQMIFQDPFASLNPRHTVGKSISDGPVANGIHRRDADQRTYELLEQVGLDQSAFSRYPNQFSGGQRQRIGIARALALDPKLIVADEAVSALDVSVQAQVLDLLHELQERLNIALIFITHDLRVAAQICDSVAVMHKGVFVEHGTPAQIFDAPQDPYTQRLIAAEPGKDWHPGTPPHLDHALPESGLAPQTKQPAGDAVPPQPI